MRVLVIEDEARLCAQLGDALHRAGFAVDATGSGEEGLFLGLEYPVDLAVVDLGLPDLPGLRVIQRWRDAGRDLPVLILTARDRWQDKVAGLEAGADDYLAKPFHMEELLARLRALARRRGGWASARLELGPVSVDTGEQRVTVEGRAVALTAFEYRLLEHLALHCGQVLSKTELSEHLYDEDADTDSNVLEVLVARLRRKLDPQGRLQPIETLRGRGYRLRLPRPAPGGP